MTTVLTKNKTIDFNKLLPDFKRFTSKNNDREVLNYLYCDGEYLITTNGFTLIRINKNNVHDLPATGTFYYDMYKKEVVQDDSKLKYPNVERLFPDWSNTTVKLNSNELKEIRKSLDVIIKENKEDKIKNCITNLNINKNTFTLSNKESCFKSDNYIIEGDSLEINFNGSFLKNALMTINKLKNINNNDYLTMEFTGRLRPIFFNQKGVYDIIITPVRVQ